MASAGLNDELTCSICLSIYTDPVMLSCGHNFCDLCISSSLDSQQISGIYTCPECRAEFSCRPPLQMNLKLRNIVKHYLSTETRSEKVEVFCTYCVGSPVLAVKTCLHCEASVCNVHLSTHSKSEKHILTDPTVSMEDKKCSIHNEPLQYFCFQDCSTICMTCAQDAKHKGHRMELLNEAFEKKKFQLSDFLNKLILKTTDNDKHLYSLQESKKRVQGIATNIKEKIAALFGDIRGELLALENRAFNEVTRQEEQVLSPLSHMAQKLEKESEDMHKRMLGIKELCSITDPATLLRQQVISTDLEKHNFWRVNNNEDLDEVMILVTLQRVLSRLPCTIHDLKAKRGFNLTDDLDMILNVNTACNNIALSHNLKHASHCDIQKFRPHHPERFMTQQVLSTRKYSSGQHYWEVKASNTGEWSIGVTYNSVWRKYKGNTSFIGKNNKSWCLNWSNDEELTAEHDDEEEYLFPFSSAHFAIYLDYEGGLLSFYELSEPIRHLHTFTAIFTEPLHAAFYLNDGGWIQIGS
ncbi:E3 ubiquitin/ISG15 ligase TRIM25-like [Rhinophrynus dorsalis]